MSYTVDKVMELTGMEMPNVTIEYIRQAFNDMALEDHVDQKVSRIGVYEGKTEYPLPADADSNVLVSVLWESLATELMEEADRTIGSGNNWTNGTMDSFSNSSLLAVSNDAVGQYCYLDDSVVEVGKQYNLLYTVTISPGTFTLNSPSAVKYGDFVTGAGNYITFTATETGGIRIYGTASAGSAIFDNFSIKETSQDKYRRATRIIGPIYDDTFDREE